MSKSSIKTTPHAAVIIFNYKERLVGGKMTTVKESQDVDVKLVSTHSLINIQTSKSKSSPAGSFSLTLAPTRNWIADITAGSWLCILMSSQTPITEKDVKDRANEKHLKMIGRVDSVRMSYRVDPGTGARSTVYNITGSDWGQFFDTPIYIDPVFQAGVTGQSDLQNLLALSNLTPRQSSKANTEKIKRTSRSWILALLEILGQPLNLADAKQDVQILIKAITKYRLPTDMAKFLGMSSSKSSDKATNLASLIMGCVRTGRLKTIKKGNQYDQDEYRNNDLIDETMILPSSFIGTHSLWQLIGELSGSAINETYCDIRFENGTPKFCLYNRVRPFMIRKDFSGMTDVTAKNPATPRQLDIARRAISRFKDVKRTYLPLEHIIGLEMGTNWRDKVNFVEVRLSGTPDNVVVEDLYKNTAQIADVRAFDREGFRPFFAITKSWPAVKDGNSEVPKPDDVSAWKFNIKEWHFDTHRLLNGTVSIIGQDKYIEVGSNVMIPAKVLGVEYSNLSSKVQKAANKKEIYLMAHVENISHSFSVSEDGARNYSTTIQFVRGIITDSEGNSLEEWTREEYWQDDAALDKDASKVKQSKYPTPVISTVLNPAKKDSVE